MDWTFDHTWTDMTMHDILGDDLPRFALRGAKRSTSESLTRAGTLSGVAEQACSGGSSNE
jgi:hypothetical protein